MKQGIEFELPDDLIAKSPAQPRDSARLLVYDRSSRLVTDDVFSNIEKYLVPSTSLVVNNALVDKCRYIFGSLEVFVLQKHSQDQWLAMVRPGRKFRLGSKVRLIDFLEVKVIDINQDGHRLLELNISTEDIRLKAYEHIPLPPYIPQDDSLANEYQTVFAKHSGSKAAPTAGLHFTPELLDRITEHHQFIEITLNVGLGTFASLTDEQIKAKKLHLETYRISEDSAKHLNTASHITAVGTTSLRTLESAYRNKTPHFIFGDSQTDIFIQPGYEFNAVNSLITNFHLPGTSLLMLVEAFVGSRSETERIYEHAISERYRFYSFGDAMLII